MTDVTHLLDANVLIALANDTHVHHGAAHRWFATVTSWATTPITESAYVRLQSNGSVTGRQVMPGEAVAALRQMRTLPGHRWIVDDVSFTDPPRLDMTRMVGRQQVTDFHLLNLAARAGAVLATFDAKLARALPAGDRRLVHVVPAAP